MPRYITEDDAFRVLSEYYKHKTYYQHVALAEAIQEIPTADVVEVVRCKDCKHWCNHKRLEIPWCRAMHIDRNAEDFCSDGERRNDA